MKRILLTLLLLSPLAFAENEIILSPNAQGECCADTPVIIFQSQEPEDGISMRGEFKRTGEIGDILNIMVGDAELVFTRTLDNKSFSISAFNTGFDTDYKKETFECYESFLEVGQCIIESPVLYDLKKYNEEGEYFRFREPLEFFVIDSSYLRITELFTSTRGASRYSVYKIIDTPEDFGAVFLYSIPDGAKWIDEKTWVAYYADSASEGVTETVGEIAPNEWVTLSRSSAIVEVCEATGDYELRSQEFKYNMITKKLERIVDQFDCV